MNKLVVSSSPHIRTQITTDKIMRDVIVALVPASIAAIVFFGWTALLNIVICVGTCVLSEYVFNRIIKKEQTIGDLSAVVTGLLLALNLSTKASVWHCIVGSVFAIVVVKCLFGGIGCNFANPAISARILLMLSFASVGGGVATNFQDELVAGATPLEIINNGAEGTLPSLLDMFLGNRGGAIGETCAIALLLGGAYLVARKVINWHTPVIFIGTVFVISLIAKGSFELALYEVLGGGLLLGAIFMATDYSTTPINKYGKMVFALGCGLITCLIRFLGAYSEGVSFAILLMNILSPYIEKLCATKPFRKVGENK
ncbi:MAG: RnfABCDGE type electron transport complex subunit D [Clostridia bacterium]|nr:RnfABCDGE type electron transport complex subunit D [Clostridia bacterium]